ncbi:MAG: tRNA(Ile)(2)-agmatinylcytidine synthase [Candidatus Thermoplasmatota archaeon]
MYIGIDDTDSSSGMCTTYVLTEVISKLPELDIIGYPRLVRLNPNIPWKTRGNGAVCVRLGVGQGKKTLIGKINGKEIYSYEHGLEKEAKVDETVDKVLRENAHFKDRKTNPAFVITNKKIKLSLYWKAVREIVKVKEVEKILKYIGAKYFFYKGKRGIVGSAASIAWKPMIRSYELLAYRKKELWGKKRNISTSSVIKMDKKFKSTFHNYDYANKRVCMVPHSPCPILFGIRGWKKNVLVKALREIRGEEIDRWLIFETNQGTDNHLKRMNIKDLKPYVSPIITSKVFSEPKTIPGGHTFFQIKQGNFLLNCAAYEPTKEFRSVIRELLPGDKVEVYGSYKNKTLNIEKINVLRLAKLKKKIENPSCCGKKMKSIGKNKGYRCIRCGRKVGQSSCKFIFLNRKLRKGYYGVAVCARRHLSKPIQRTSIISFSKPH